MNLDVRPLVARGEEPLGAILGALETLQLGETLVLHAPFEPVPLYAVLARSGFSWEDPHMQGGVCELRISHRRDSEDGELDLRVMAPAEVAPRALAAAARIGRNDLLIVHTRSQPSILLDQLDDRGFDGESEQSAAAHWVTRIWRLIT